MKRIHTILIILMLCAYSEAHSIKIVTISKANSRVEYAAEYIKKKLSALGYTFPNHGNDYKISLKIASDTTGLKKEGFRITSKKNHILVEGYDGSGVIYGCNELAEYAALHHNINIGNTVQNPEMVLRGSCVGLQKTVYLPGHQVYEYPYTPENFPWFYDKKQWIEYLDMLVDNKMNSLYLWNGHPFASLVKLKDYPFAVEVDEDTFKKNEEIWVICKSPWIKVDMVALFLPQDVAQL